MQENTLTGLQIPTFKRVDMFELFRKKNQREENWI